MLNLKKKASIATKPQLKAVDAALPQKESVERKEIKPVTVAEQQVPQEPQPSTKQKKQTVVKQLVKQKKKVSTASATGTITKKIEKTTDNALPKEEILTIEAKADKLQGLTVVGNIELPAEVKKDKKSTRPSTAASVNKIKRKRKRVKASSEKKPTTYNSDAARTTANKAKYKKGAKPKTEGVSKKEVTTQFRKTISKLGSSRLKGNKSKYRREKKEARAASEEARLRQEEENANKLKVTEFISANELATLMDVSINEIISTFLAMGMVVSINQRLDSESIEIITDEFGFEAEFTSAEQEIDVQIEEKDREADLEERPPIVTIMGHVDHGKTSLLDFVRKSKVAEKEAGGITQHIGAYDVKTKSGKNIIFLDTPGHEAFTAMRARGAKVTDIAIIVIAADDSVMPQTTEAINHAQIANVPIIFALNKIDKPNADTHKIKQELANKNILVEDWGGKYQCFEISAKQGLGIDELLEGILLESEVLELKANANKNAVGTVIEAALDKGRGYVTTVLIQAGTLKMGDVVLAGSHFGKVRAMLDQQGKKIKKAGPSVPIQLLGLNGAPQAGDKLNALDSDREARDIATKREQILREQSIRATKRTTLTDIGRRIQIGSFRQLNIILKADVGGSVEALTDSLQKLSVEEIEINVIHKAVGPISEGDVLLASASEAIVIGFQVRPTPSARKIAEKEHIEIRLYAVIYDAIEDIKAAIQGLLAPKFKEVTVGNMEVRDTFRISKVGTVAGCYVTNGYIKRNSKIRLIRDGIVVFGGEKGAEIQTLKRFKEDTNEVKQGFECGLNIKNFNDIKVDDIIEVFEERAIENS